MRARGVPEDMLTGDNVVPEAIFRNETNFSEKIPISYPLIHTRTCAYQEVKNVSFSENFACVLNESPLH